PADLIGAITIPEDLNGDGILNADELGTDGSFNAQVALGPDAVDGTVVNGYLECRRVRYRWQLQCGTFRSINVNGGVA
ncbi:hypothetical protein ECE15_10910, partial [Acinetobacter baumannii]|nr:hypothetical protein [Acinetobacter baumannii]